jgi:hypothetical protein
MKQIIAVAVALLVVFAAAPTALACWTVVSCTGQHPCTSQVSSVDSRCAWGQVGQTRTSGSGSKCSWENGPGAVGCLTHIKILWSESWCVFDPVLDDYDCCRAKSFATLSGIGCCQQPCPPNVPECHEN